jgi:glutamate 5-kinase
METKLIAAEIATEAGVNTVIASSRNPEGILTIIQYHATASIPGLNVSNIMRPKHTLFKPSLNPMRDMKSWTSHTLSPAGTVIIDMGAHVVLSRKESGGRLLPVGVIGVKGSFASHQAVRVCIKAKTDSVDVSGKAQVEDPEAAVREYARGVPMGVLASASATPTTAGPASGSDLTTGVHQLLHPSNPNLPSAVEEDRAAALGDSDPVDSWQLVEVGRGLANYNSEQIDKVKKVNRCVCGHCSRTSWRRLVFFFSGFRGVRGAESLLTPPMFYSSSLSKILGYADSDYVVENITIRIPA